MWNLHPSDIPKPSEVFEFRTVLCLGDKIGQTPAPSWNADERHDPLSG